MEVELEMTSVLAVGLGSRAECLAELPVDLDCAETARDAVAHLRVNRPDVVIGRWDLSNGPSGSLLSDIVGARPGLRTVAVISAGDIRAEIDARCAGITAIVPDDLDDDYFADIVCQLLGLGVFEEEIGVEADGLCVAVG
jgi:DNA-binding NarL/FixJ family response regulator